MANRRSRYTIYLSDEAVVIGDPEPVVLLTWSMAEAWIWATKRYGDLVLDIEAGDYRKKARHQEIREAAKGYTIDRKLLDSVIKDIGLIWPVEIRFHGRIGDCNGNYHLRHEPTLHHDIMLKRYHTAEQANSTLWHELRHALQAEAAGGFTEWRDERNRQHKYPYKRRPMELEAQAFAKEFAPAIKLVS